MKKFSRGFIVTVFTLLVVGSLLILSAGQFADHQQATIVSSMNQTVVLQDGLAGYGGTADTYIYSFPTHDVLNFGNSAELRSSPVEKYNILARFKIFQSEGGPIPNHAVIIGAKLSLYKYTTYDSVFAAYRVKKDWLETEATWLRARQNLPWTKSGEVNAEDVVIAPDGVGTVGWDSGWLTIDVTSGVRAFAQGELNAGWEIIGTGGNSNTKKFYSRESGVSNLRPKLEITYSTGGGTTATDTTAPSVPTGLTATAVSPSQINLSWIASTDAVGVTGYKIFRGGTQIATVEPEPGALTKTTYSNTGLSLSTSYSYTISAYDAAGNVSGQSTSAGATTLASADTTLPTVSITAPASSATVSGSSVAVSANASDNVGVVGVQFKLDGTNLSTEDTSSPYSISWNSTSVSNGSYSLTAVARDATGNQGTSGSVSVTVNNIGVIAPTVTLSASPTSVISGGSATLTWSSTNVTSCTASGAWSRTKATSGTQVVSPTVTSTYTLTCTGSGRSIAQSTTVTVTATLISTKFNINDRVQTTAALNVRATPSILGTLLGTQPISALGAVIGGPTYASGYHWWQINYDTGADGWSVENYLVKVPSLVDGGAAGWTELAHTNIHSVCPPNEPGKYDWNSFCKGVIDAWGGGAVDTLRNRLIVFGGGHSDYAGNEIYAVNLLSSTVQRITNPSPPNLSGYNIYGDTCPSALSDGAPNSRHSYDGVAYIHDIDRLFAFGGSLACKTGNGDNVTWMYDFASGHWLRMNPTGTLPRWDLGIVTAYDPNSRKVFVHDNYSLSAYDIATNAFTRLTGDSDFVDIHMTATIDPIRKKLVIVGGGWSSTGGVIVYNIGSGSTYTRESWATTGGNAVVNAASPGLAYDPVSDRIIGWAGGNTVYSLNMDTKVWTPITFSGGPGVQGINGTFGRFDYMPASKAFAVVNHVDRNAFLLRLASTTVVSVSDTVSPSVNITAPAAGTTVSGTAVTISANASDNIGVVGVQFKLDGANFGSEDTISPYGIIWNTTGTSNGTHTLTAIARDAAGNTGISGSVSVTVSNAGISIEPGVFTAILAPDKGKGVPGQGMKHVTFTYNPDNGRIYQEGGDFPGLFGEQSYRQDTYSLSIAERLADPANRNAGWRQEYAYCGPAGKVQPKHPDFVGWTWDSKRHIFWMVPGTMEVSSAGNCPGETISRVSDPAFLLNHIMTFDPIAQEWTDRGTNIGLDPAETWQSIYDPITDTIVRFGFNGGSGGVVNIYNIASNSWTRVGLGLNALGKDIRLNKEGLTADLAHRYIYAVDGFLGRLHRFNMDTKKMEDLGSVPGGANISGSTNDAYVAWNSNDNILYFFRLENSKLYIYHPDTKIWGSPTMATSPLGLYVAMRHAMIFDPANDVLVMMGGVDPVNPYIFLYRY